MAGELLVTLVTAELCCCCMPSSACLQSRQTFKVGLGLEMEVREDNNPLVLGVSPATELGRSYRPSVLDRRSLTLLEFLTEFGVADLAWLLLTKCGLDWPGLNAKTGMLSNR